jgi:hypothetical protein
MEAAQSPIARGIARAASRNRIAAAQGECCHEASDASPSGSVATASATRETAGTAFRPDNLRFSGRRCGYADSANRRGFVEIMQQSGLLEHSCQIYNAGESTTGMSRQALRDFAADADLLIDISGHVTAEFVLEAVGTRAYLD